MRYRSLKEGNVQDNKLTIRDSAGDEGRCVITKSHLRPNFADERLGEFVNSAYISQKGRTVTHLDAPPAPP